MSSGSTPFNDPGLTASVTSEFNGAGDLVGVDIYNPNTVVVYVQFFDVAAANVASITLGSSAPTLWIPVSPGGAVHGPFSNPSPTFNNGIAMAATTTPTGSTAPALPLSVVGFTY